MTAVRSFPKIAYCPMCGLAAAVIGASLDPAHPLVICSRTGDDGEDHGHGRQLGDYDPEAGRIRRQAAHVERVTAHHQAHVNAGRPHADCRRCLADPPQPRVTPHPYEPQPRKYRAAAHLEFMHGDRTLHHNLTLRELPELEDHHRELHAAMDAGA